MIYYHFEDNFTDFKCVYSYILFPYFLKYLSIYLKYTEKHKSMIGRNTTNTIH